MKDEKYCIDLIKEFVEKYLQGDYEKLIDFPMGELNKKDEYKKFSCQDGSFDCDNTELVKSILFIFYKNNFEKYDISFNYDDIGTGKKLRGDTINTFNTLFSEECAISIENNDFKAPEFAYNADNDFIEELKKFYKNYHLIGNFIFLPNLGKDELGTTFNTFRGTRSGWGDYFDKFLTHLSRCYDKSYENNKYENERWKEELLYKLMQYNDFYFGENKIDTLKKFCKVNALDDYADFDYKSEASVKNISGGELEVLRHANYSSMGQALKKEYEKTYLEYALHYMKTANKLIEERSKKVIDIVIYAIEKIERQKEYNL